MLRILLAVAAGAIAAHTVDSDRVAAMVTVTTGAHAGSFLVRNADSPCEITEQKAPRSKHQFEVLIDGVTPKAAANELTVLMLIIPNADVRGPNHSFFASIRFGTAGDVTEFRTETRSGEKAAGSGTVTLAPHGQDATVMLDVTSADGLSYTGTIQCSGVSRT
jgi:hypothetical protein